MAAPEEPDEPGEPGAPTASEPAGAGASAGTTSLNQQILDAVARGASLAASGSFGPVAAEQLVILTLTLAMQNAVTQQQQLYMLQNAATTALVKTLLDAGPDHTSRWSEALQLVQGAFSTAEVEQTLVRLKDMLEHLTARAAAAAAATAAAAPAEPAAPPAPKPPEPPPASVPR